MMSFFRLMMVGKFIAEEETSVFKYLSRDVQVTCYISLWPFKISFDQKKIKLCFAAVIISYSAMFC